MSRAPVNDHRVVIVDDEPDLCLMVADYLGRYEFAVRAVQRGADLDACLAQQPADLLILDVNMPGEDGFSVARRVRLGSRMPILMLTSVTDVIDRVVALELGVDDYLTKPFDLRELLARVRALLRRAAITAEPAPAQPPVAKGTRFGAVTLDFDSRCLIGDDGARQALTASEFSLLRVFAGNPNRVLSRDRLLDLTEHSGREPFDRSIDIRITRLRRKIEIDPAHPTVIKTVRGTGYMFVPPVDGLGTR